MLIATADFVVLLFLLQASFFCELHPQDFCGALESLNFHLPSAPKESLYTTYSKIFLKNVDTNILHNSCQNNTSGCVNCPNRFLR